MHSWVSAQVPPSSVDLYLTNTGPHHPSYVSRLLSELYAPEDHDLSGEGGEA